MLGGKDPDPGSATADPLRIDSKVAGLDPVRKRRGDGAVFESSVLGRLEFVQMPANRPSFWHGVQRMPDSGIGLKIVCEVERDEPPGADHEASVVAIRRRQIKDAQSCLALVQGRLRELRLPADITVEDLRLCGIHLSSRPMLGARQILEYRVTPAPGLEFLVVFQHGRPTAVHVDSAS
jgi:hypothetical protein